MNRNLNLPEKNKQMMRMTSRLQPTTLLRYFNQRQNKRDQDQRVPAYSREGLRGVGCVSRQAYANQCATYQSNKNGPKEERS